MSDKSTERARAAAATARWRARNPEKVLAYRKKQRAENGDALRKRELELYQANRASIIERKRKWYIKNADKLKAQRRARRLANPEKAKERNRRDARAYRSTVKGRLENRIRVGFLKGLIRGSKAGRKTFDLLGYSAEELRVHLGSWFLPGMSWDNFGPDWHIDHVIPLAAHNYDSPDQIDFRRAWALANLRPLWSNINKSKGAKLSAPFQPSLAI